MRQRTLPGTDLSLSVVGMGLWPAGGRHWGPVDDDESIAAIRRAVELGVDWFDTAPLYGDGHADRILRRALGAHIGEVTIATKVGAQRDASTDEAWSDLRPESIREDCHASLQRLGVQRIDLLQVHWPCERGTPIAETIGALERLRDEGSIRAFGLCNYDAAGLQAALEAGAVASLQTPYSIVRRDADAGLLSTCEAREVGVLAYETLCRGLLTGKFGARPPRFGPDDMRRQDPRFWGERFLRIASVARTLDAIATKVHVPTSALAVGWVLQRPGVTAAVVGAKSPAQVEANVRAAALVDQPRLWQTVDRLLAA
ncbi:MAG: aldo/keto reductase [Deltaproteobacteria bacterium]|nr:aldo/keto reductase [Deltaproteobacteria bacterium]